MLDPNIEQTQPTKPNESLENTQPVGTTPPSLEDTAPITVNTPGLEDTSPVGVAPVSEDDTSPVSVSVPPARVPRWPIILGGILLILLLTGAGGYLGYRAAIAEKILASNNQSTNLATEQFMMGVQEQSQGHYELAIRHYEYVIQIDPNFPGVKDKLAQAMLASALEKTPTVTVEVVIPTPTIALTPTPDLRGEEEIFNNARSLMENKEWVKALEVLDTLRTKNITYRAVDVDGMYYVALRYRGVLYINSGRLESGLYDLALTERFGPLDIDSNGLRTWARMYLTGASFWGVRWDKVVEIFAQIYPYYPNLHDINGFTSLERFRKASLAYGDQFAAQQNFCEAYKQYKNAQDARSDPAVEPTLKAAFLICYPPTPTPTKTPTITLTPTKGQELSPTVDSTTPAVETPTNTSPAPAASPTPTNTTAAPAASETPSPAPTDTPKP